MRFELADLAGTGFRFEFDDEVNLVEVTLANDPDCVIAELTLEQADRWRNGSATVHTSAGFRDVLTAETVTGEDDTSANDLDWLDSLGIGEA